MPDPLSQLPYYREYVDQILRPRVGRMVDELRTNLTEQIWGALVERLAQDQGGAADPKAAEKLRAMLTETLGLKLSVQLNADFTGAPGATAAAPNSAPQNAVPGVTPNQAPEVVDRVFPNNPLARAVGGVRSAGR